MSISAPPPRAPPSSRTMASAARNAPLGRGSTGDGRSFLRDDVKDLAEIRRVDHVLAIGVDDAGLSDCGEHALRFILGEAERLLADDVPARLGCE